MNSDKTAKKVPTQGNSPTETVVKNEDSGGDNGHIREDAKGVIEQAREALAKADKALEDGGNQDLTNAEARDAESLAQLILARTKAEQLLFNFFEAVPASSKQVVHERALLILDAYREKSTVPETSIQ